MSNLTTVIRMQLGEIERLGRRVGELEKKYDHAYDGWERECETANKLRDELAKLRNAQGEPVAEVVSYHQAGLYDELPIGALLYASTLSLSEDRQRDLQGHFRKILQHHGLTEHGDGVLEGDLLAAVLTALDTQQK